MPPWMDEDWEYHFAESFNLLLIAWNYTNTLSCWERVEFYFFIIKSHFSCRKGKSYLIVKNSLQSTRRVHLIPFFWPNISTVFCTLSIALVSFFAAKLFNLCFTVTWMLPIERSRNSIALSRRIFLFLVTRMTIIIAPEKPKFHRNLPHIIPTN